MSDIYEDMREMNSDGYDAVREQVINVHKKKDDTTQELENEDVIMLKKENEQLKNRCIVLSHGLMCSFCPNECKHRTTEFRGDVKSNE